MGPNDRASKLAHKICIESYENCQAAIVFPHDKENFRGPVGFTWKNHILNQMKYSIDKRGIVSPGAMLQAIENDGAGGKTQFSTFLGGHEAFQNLGWEIITMTADDFARSKRFPAVMVNEINVKDITESNFHMFKALMEGYGKALKASNLVNLTGETAIMKNSITAFCDINSPCDLVLTWGGTCIGLSHRNLLTDNSKIKPGMIIVGLNENGYRCNGGTFLTRIIENEFGETARHNSKARNFVKKLIVPSVSYAKTITRIAGWNADGSIGEPLAEIIAAAHITGGGMKKLREILPAGVHAYLDSMPKPPTVLLEAQEMSFNDSGLDLSDSQAYTTFHGGCGMYLIVPSEEDAEIVIQEAWKDGIEAQVVGKTLSFREQRTPLIIESQFTEKNTVYMH